MNIKNKKVLVTGADGFIGSHLVEKLVSTGCEVKALVFYNSFNSWGWLDTLPEEVIKKIDVVSGDIRDSSLIETTMAECDIVYHLAALIGIPYSYVAPNSYVETNIVGTLNILESAKKLKTDRLLITSTSEVYGTAQYTPIDEKHRFQGQSPYSASKVGADRLAESYFRSFNVPLSIVRPFNTYGPRQSARAIIPTIITQILLGKKKIKLGNLNTTRDLNFVDDIVSGFIEISKSSKTIGEEINISSGKEISMADLAKKIIKISKKDVSIISEKKRIRPKNSEVDRLIGDSSKLKNLTKWKSQTTLDEGLLKTYNWFKDQNNLSRYKGIIYNI